MCVDSERVEFREPAFGSVTVWTMSAALVVEEVRAARRSAGDVDFLGHVFAQFCIGGARRELKLPGEEVECALEANLQSAF